MQAAFVHGMDLALLVSAGVALAGLMLTLLFLPRASTPRAVTHAPAGQERAIVRAR